MSDHASWYVELAIKPGQFDNFHRLTNEMVEFARSEDGVLIYERFITEDETTVHIYERYIDSTAAVLHLVAFKERFGERFSKLVDRKNFTVFGRPSDQLKQLLDPFGVQYVAPLDGFS